MIDPGDFFVLRTPLFSRSKIKELTIGSSKEGEEESSLVLKYIRGKLVEIYKNEESLRQGLFLASPDLFRQLERWMMLALVANDHLTKKQKKELKALDKKFLMFLLRASYRCTPFGTFASVSVGKLKLQRESSLNLNLLTSAREEEVAYTRSRLDMVYLLKIRSIVEADSKLRENLKFFPNNTLYKNGEDMLCSFFNEKELQHVASSKKFNEVAWDLFEVIINNKGMTISEMVIHLLDEEVTEEDCRIFIDFLIDQHLLISELYPRMHGEEYMKILCNKISSYPDSAKEKYQYFLKTIQYKLNIIDQASNYIKGTQGYQELFTFLTQSPEASRLGLNIEDIKEKELIQVDAFKEIRDKQQELSKTVVRDITRKIEQLFSLSKGYKSNPGSDLEIFKKAFLRRYEYQEVSLLKVMDEVIGLGYPYGRRVAKLTPYLEELDLILYEEIPQELPPTPITAYDALEHLLERKYAQALQNKQVQITISADEVKYLGKNHQQKIKFQPAMIVMGKLLYGIPDDLIHDPKNNSPRNFFFELYHVLGPTVGNLLGRFCHGNVLLKEQLKTLIANIETDTEEVIYAEIDHLPGKREGNVILRPQLREYSITVGGPNTKEKGVIPLSDLFISMPDGENLKLRSKVLQKQIIPRMSSAHNYSSNAHPLYKFLCDLQNQNINKHSPFPRFFDSNKWQNRAYLPRLTFENLILSLRKWRLNKSDFESISLTPKTSADDLEKKVTLLRQIYFLPGQVLLVEGDNKLYIDLKNQICVEILLEKAFKKGGSPIILEEVIEEHYPSQSVCNEMIFPIITKSVNEKHQKDLGTYSRRKPQKFVQKNFDLGSQWIYFKIYLGNLGADQTISQSLYPLSEDLRRKKLIDQWFFIRYNDSEFGSHLRWRLHLQDVNMFGKVIEFCTQSLLNLKNAGRISHYVTDTYQREVSRYLPINMENTEEWFTLDSVLVSKVLWMIKNGSPGIDENSKFLFALVRIITLLDNFCKENKERQLKIIQRGTQNFTKEFNFDKHPRSKKLKNLVENELAPKVMVSAEKMESFRTLFEYEFKKEGKLAEYLFDNLKAVFGENERKIEETLTEIVGSYVHMFVNRFFSTAQRIEEMCLYNCLQFIFTTKS